MSSQLQDAARDARIAQRQVLSEPLAYRPIDCVHDVAVKGVSPPRLMTRVLPAVSPTDHRLITLRSEIGNCDVLGFLQGARRVLLSGGGGGGADFYTPPC